MNVLLVDGYNVIGASEWRDRPLSDSRDALIGQLNDYAGYTGEDVVLVFDAHQSGKLQRTKEKHGHVRVVFTKAHETADHYIERMADQLSGNPRTIVRVATSDALEQSTVLARGAIRVPARELWQEIFHTRTNIRQALEKHNSEGFLLGARLSPEQYEALERMRRGSV